MYMRPEFTSGGKGPKIHRYELLALSRPAVEALMSELISRQ
ncbi:hypothetical protein MMMB2_0964 [Mycobacterium marinum MB2]|nr:hypothetical protein MMMB2_0964 [Mycobacterium marinum MB2]